MSDKIPSKALNVLRYIAQWPEQPFLYEDISSRFPEYDVERYLNLLSDAGFIQSSFPVKSPYVGENDFSMVITEEGLNFLESLDKSPLALSILKALGSWIFDHCSPSVLLGLMRRFFN